MIKIDKSKYYLIRTGTREQIEDWKKWARKEKRKMKGLKTIKNEGEYWVYNPYENLE